MPAGWEESRRAFADAARWFADTTAGVGDRWTLDGLGEWDVRSLVGHTSRALLTVETYLAQPASEVEVATTEEYFRLLRSPGAGSAVADRGRAAGAELGPDPTATVAAIAARVVRLVEGCAGSELVSTPAGGMRLADYLPTRTFELAVHTTDLARAIGAPTEMPKTSGAQALEVVSRLAVADGRASELLVAVTGRSALPPGFSVL